MAATVAIMSGVACTEAWPMPAMAVCAWESLSGKTEGVTSSGMDRSEPKPQLLASLDSSFSPTSIASRAKGVLQDSAKAWEKLVRPPPQDSPP